MHWLLRSGPIRAFLAPIVLITLSSSLVAGQTPIDTAEFSARRARLLAMVPDGIAVILGAEEHPYPVRFRQAPDFFYLTGIEEPGTVLLLNGVTKKVAVFALKRLQFGPPAVTPDLRSLDKPQERYGVAVLPMENFFTYFQLRERESAGEEAVRSAYPTG